MSLLFFRMTGLLVLRDCCWILTCKKQVEWKVSRSTLVCCPGNFPPPYCAMPRLFCRSRWFGLNLFCIFCSAFWIIFMQFHYELYKPSCWVTIPTCNCLICGWRVCRVLARHVATTGIWCTLGWGAKGHDWMGAIGGAVRCLVAFDLDLSAAVRAFKKGHKVGLRKLNSTKSGTFMRIE